MSEQVRAVISDDPNDLVSVSFFLFLQLLLVKVWLCPYLLSVDMRQQVHVVMPDDLSALVLAYANV